MENSIRVQHYAQLNHLVETASQFSCAVHALDSDGNRASAKSILGLLRLNLKEPLLLESDNAAALRILVRSFS